MGSADFEWTPIRRWSKGSPTLACELYDGEAPGEIVARKSKLMQGIGFDRMISPTRMHGFTQIESAIQALAQRYV
jgi:sulfur transfer protein SufE